MQSIILRIGMPMLLLLQAVMPAAAVSAKNTEDKPKNQVPIVIEGEKLSVNDSTGDVSAQGNVSIMQNQEKLLTEQVRGNIKKSEFWMDGKADFFQPGTTLSGVGSYYNYLTHNGTMQSAAGKIDRQFVTGKHIDVSNGEYVLHDGTTTMCSAKVPDYHISAKRIEILPGDKLVAYDAKFWIKDKVIFALPKYQTSLEKDRQASIFPRVGYYSEDGIFIKQYLEYPISENVAAFGDLGYYSKTHFRMSAGVIDREKNYTMSLVTGHYRDGDANWIYKEPEFKIDYGTKRLGTLPVSYNFWASYGKWDDNQKSSWHQDYSLYFTRDPIELSNKLRLDMGTGFEYVRESYDNSAQKSFKYDITLTKEWSPRFNSWVGYHYTQNNNGLFAYERADLSREINVGFLYKLDKMNALLVNESYDAENNRVKDIDYTWKRNMHCFEMDFKYRAKRQQFGISVSAIHF